MANTYVVGIDLGTTNTLACYMKNSKLELIKFPGSGSMLPSVIYTDADKNVSIGKRAITRGIVEPQNMIRSAKTYIGKFEENKTWTCNGKTYNPTDVAIEVLKEVRRAVVKTLTKSVGYKDGDEIGAVITVPAYFNSNQTDETRKAGEAAGFKVIQIITEPMAAAVTVVNELQRDSKVFVFDLGGGTFDMAVLEANQEEHLYKAIAIAGNPRLGGDDFDEAVKKYLIKLIQDDIAIDLSSYQAAGMSEQEYLTTMNDILMEAQEAKKGLSESDEVDIDRANLFKMKDGTPYNLEISLSIEEFNEICKPIFDEIETSLRKFVDGDESKKKFRKDELSDLILAGGSCHIRRVREIVQNVFGRAPRKVLDPATLVVYGACRVAEAGSSGIGLRIEDILSRSLGIEVLEGGRLILSKILEQGTTYPCSKMKPYTTTVDYQREILINIYEAGPDREDVEDITAHEFYGQMPLTDIELAPANVPDIQVTFQYDKSRCLTVTAVDTKIGKPRQIEIKKNEKAAVTPTERPIDFVLLLDSSGSMIGAEMAEAKEASLTLFDDMIDLSVHRMALISFADHATKQSGLTHDRNVLRSNIENIYAGGLTNMLEPLQKAYSELSSSTNEKVIIMVTDGYPTDYANEALNYAKNLRSRDGIHLVVIGAGGGVNMDYLLKLTGGDDVYNISNMSELKVTFQKAIPKIMEKIKRNR